MIEEQILQTIGDRIEDERLHFQAIIQDRTLYLYINRDTDEYIDYSQLTATIKTAIAELELDLLAVELNSRMLGEVEPDWQRSIDLEAIASEVKQEVAATKSLVEQIEQEEIDALSASETQPNTDLKAELTTESAIEDEDRDREAEEETVEAEKSVTEDFSQYCFTRNKGLIEADIVPPQTKIAQLLDVFAKFEISQQRSQLPLLAEYFKNSQEPDLSDFTPEIQNWWTEAIALDGDPKRKFAIWLSRYCFNPENTIATVNETLDRAAETKKYQEEQIKQQAKEERETRNKIRVESFSTADSTNSSSSNSQSSPVKNSKQGDRSWLGYASVVVTIKLILLVLRIFFNNYNNSYTPIAADAPVEKNYEIQAQYNTKTLEEAKRIADLGVKEHRAGNNARAEQYAEQALLIFPQYARAYRNRGVLKEGRGDFSGALADHNKAIELYPDNLSPDYVLHQAYASRGNVRLELEDYLGAIEDTDEAISLASDVGEYYANRGVAYYRLEDYDTAIADQTQAIELEPDYAGWHFYRGTIHRYSGNYQQAIKDLNKAIALDSSFGLAYEQRHYAYLQLNDWAKAKKDYQKAKSLGVEPESQEFKR